MLNRFKSFVNLGNERSIRFKKNVLSLLVLRVLSIFLSFLLVPLTINYVDTTQYGIWLTLSSVVGWMSFFDIGLSNGLRNRFAQAVARNDTSLARKYVSTTYAILSLIFIPVLAISITVSLVIDWGKLLNVDIADIQNFTYVVVIVFIYFAIKFILSTINVILNADQRPAESSLRSLIEQVVSIIVIFVLTKTTDGSLLYLSIALCIIPLIVLLLFNVTLFNTRYRQFSPSFKFIEFRVAPDLFNLGMKFFVIQISGIIKYQTSSFIIIRSFGAIEVTNYNIAYKYFMVLPMVWNIFAAPVWSAVTEAFEKSDIQWIINMEKKMRLLTLLLGISGIFMVIVSGYIYDFWIGKDVVNITIALTIWSFLYNFTKVFGGTYVQILNGLGYLKIQFYSTIGSLFIFVLSLYLMIHVLHWGSYSVFIAATISNFNAYFLAPYQFKQVILNNRKGIWAK